jgi:hypothetical protein
MAVKQLAARGGKGSAGKGRTVTGSVIRASIPYVKADVPVLVLFRALGTVVSCYLRGLASNASKQCSCLTHNALLSLEVWPVLKAGRLNCVTVLTTAMTVTGANGCVSMLSGQVHCGCPVAAIHQAECTPQWPMLHVLLCCCCCHI